MRQVHMCADGYKSFPLMLSVMNPSTRVIKPCREVGGTYLLGYN